MTSLVLSQLKPARRELLRLAGVAAVAAAPTYASGLVVATALDRGFLAGRPGIGLAWLGLLAFLGVFGAYASAVQLPLMERVVEPLRDRLVTTVVTHGLARVVSGDGVSGTVAVRATEQAEGVRTLLIALLRSAFGLAITLSMALAGLATLVPLVAAAIVPFLVLALGAYLVLMRSLVRRQRLLLIAEERVGESSRIVLTAGRDVTAFGAEQPALARFGSDVDTAAQASRRIAQLGWWRALVPAAATQLPVVALLALAHWLAAHTDLTAGDLVGGVLYLVRGLGPAIGFLTTGGAGWLVQLGLLSERLAADIPTVPTPRPAAVLPPSGPLRLTAQGIRYAHATSKRPILDGLDLDLEPGVHLALVGPSGVGKSTLAGVLAGTRMPQAGSMTLAGTPLSEWPADVRHRVVAYLPQESYVFAGTVRENLTYLVPAASVATDERLTEAVERFGLSAAVDRFGGLDGEIPAGGDGLSMGERQLLALARVWLSPAEIVLLDEATCHLDAPAERDAELAMRERGGTLIVVAHRISSAARADLVGIVGAGRVTVGTHEGLLVTDPAYASLVAYWNAAQPAHVTEMGG